MKTRDCTKPGEYKFGDEARVGDLCRDAIGQYRIIAIAEGWAMCKRPGIATPFVTTLTIVYYDQTRFALPKKSLI